jgi:hypothetical protein
MKLWLSPIKWCLIKAGGRNKNIKGMHTVKETDMFTAKIDLLIKRLEEQA